MTNELVKKKFQETAKSWICDGYSSDVRFIAVKEDNRYLIRSALLVSSPLPAKYDHRFSIESENLLIGQIQRDNENAVGLFGQLDDASCGKIHVLNRQLVLPSDGPLSLFSELNLRALWLYDAHLQISANDNRMLSDSELAELDNILRLSDPPFDGLADAAGWLSLHPLQSNLSVAQINIRVRPPADLILEKSSLSDNLFKLMIIAHPKFDVNLLRLAIRAVPGESLKSRMQLAHEIKWGSVSEGVREGTVEIKLKRADNVLTMLMIGSSLVRREWIPDKTRAQNIRLIAVQHFDNELRMVKRAVMESSDGLQFEHGVSVLLFLLGFNASVQIEKDSPDLILTTPGGRLVLVECTTRIADFNLKMGKLVDRRRKLEKVLLANDQPSQVAAILVCRLPRDQIAARSDQLKTFNAILLTSEDLEYGFNSVRFPDDPDQFLLNCEQRLIANTGKENS